jgi:hypothetical protein
MATIYYRTKDGSTDFKFDIVHRWDGSWRAYITGMPSYGSRDTSLMVTHRLMDGNRPYVCWDRRISSEAAMQQVAAKWADLTLTYIRTGVTIDDQVRRGL